ncbi:MAG: FkbM family methyltransferase, partial [Caldilineaceae bacterium]|nr:FkbM family methyltransferase [Caldilineaceae bacterium]
KIDVEGFEAEVLRGLSRPIAVLSFEYVPATKDVALACLARLQALGTYEFNWSIGETHRWQRTEWVTIEEMRHFVQQLTVDENSGDIYARHLKT